MKAEKYFAEVYESFSTNGDDRRAPEMAKYMKDRFKFLGVNAPLRNELSREFLVKSKRPEEENLEETVKLFWESEYRELHYFAVELVKKYAKKLDEPFIELFEYMITKNSWWDTVDSIASNLVGPHFTHHYELRFPVTEGWMNSNNIWLRRSALLFQLKYKANTDFDLLTDYILRLKDSDEFFIRKAIGWALREYSKISPDKVLSFVSANKLSPLSEREATRLIK